MTTVSTTGAATTATQTSPARGFGALGSADFLKLMTTQLQQQDPFDPMDNKDMLAQMAQFSSLSETTGINSGVSDLKAIMQDISAKLDAVIAAQDGARATSAQTATAPSAATTTPAA